MPNILVTGGAGFIGSHFILHLHRAYPNYTIINLDKLTYAANLGYLESIAHSPRYRFVKGDIADAGLVKDLFRTYSPEGVIHFAAESHVDNSIQGPGIFVQTNVLGTQVLLEQARRSWKKPYRFLHVSTDEVYGSLGDTGYFTEESPLKPNSPYSASKASSDLLVRSYYHTYGMNLTITRCTNNYGPHQHDEKLIPTIIRNAIQNKPIPIYGSGQNTRDWLYVTDHCHAIDLVFQNGQSGEVYNIGSNCEWRNIDLAKTICKVLKRPESLIQSVDDRLGHDFRYALDVSKIRNQLKWISQTSFEAGLEQTIAWYLRKYSGMLNREREYGVT
ncbi:MAG: dTDP-glucose 4,6-dehydratase [Gammaproteobacteria bacterium]